MTTHHAHHHHHSPEEEKPQGRKRDDDGAAGADHMAHAGAAREGILRIVDRWEEDGKTFILIDTTGFRVTEGMTGTVMGTKPGHCHVTKVNDYGTAIAETDGELEDVERHVHLHGKVAPVKPHKGGAHGGVVDIATLGGTTVLTINKGSKAGVVEGMHGTVKRDGEAIGEIIIFGVTAREARGKTNVSVEDAHRATVEMGHAPRKKDEVTGNVVQQLSRGAGSGVTLIVDKGSSKGIQLGMLGVLQTRSGAVLEVVPVIEVRKRECVVEAMIDGDELPHHAQVAFRLDQ